MQHILVPELHLPVRHAHTLFATEVNFLIVQVQYIFSRTSNDCLLFHKCTIYRFAGVLIYSYVCMRAQDIEEP